MMRLHLIFPRMTDCAATYNFAEKKITFFIKHLFDILFIRIYRKKQANKQTKILWFLFHSILITISANIRVSVSNLKMLAKWGVCEKLLEQLESTEQ